MPLSGACPGGLFALLQDHGLHPLWATALVYLVSLVLLLAFQARCLARFCHHQPLLWLLMAAAGMTNVGFNWAVTVGDVVRVVLLFYLMPAWTRRAGLAHVWGKGRRLSSANAPGAGDGRRGDRYQGARLALAGARRALADWLAEIGGFSFALTNILLRKLHRISGRTAHPGHVRRRSPDGRQARGRAGTAVGVSCRLHRHPRWPGPAWGWR